MDFERAQSLIERGHIEVGFEGVDRSQYRATTKTLRSIAGVSDVHEPARAGEPFVLMTTERDDTSAVREAVLAAAAAKGLRLSSIREVVPSLDDIYRRALHAKGLAVTRGAAA